MSLYFICDKLGVAWASDEYGLHKWSFEDNDFTESMSTDELMTAFPSRRATESEAIAFSLANSSASKPAKVIFYAKAPE